MKNNAIALALIDTVREMANTKDCKECKYFYLQEDGTPTCTFSFNFNDECIVITKQLNLVP